MEQPTPNVTQEDVERVVRRDFPAGTFAEVMSILAEYGDASWQREAHRVRLAVLKLAEGRLDELRRQVEWAKRDYRDVLAPAEYPGYAGEWSRIGKLSEAEIEAIIEADREQYDRWLRKP